jgi:hypothetical protein
MGSLYIRRVRCGKCRWEDTDGGRARSRAEYLRERRAGQRAQRIADNTDAIELNFVEVNFLGDGNRRNDCT